MTAKKAVEISCRDRKRSSIAEITKKHAEDYRRIKGDTCKHLGVGWYPM